MRYLLPILLYILSTANIFAQIDPSNTISSSYQGKHFYLGFMQNEIDNQGILLLEILITSNYPANITVKIPNEAIRNYRIKSDSILKIDLPRELEIKENEIIEHKIIEIISNVPILIYAFNSREATSACYTAVPVSQWGQEYVAMSYPNDQYFSTFQNTHDSTLLIPRKSEFLLLAKEDKTRITVISHSMTQSLRQPGKPFYVTLNKGDNYLVQSYNYQIGEGDLTGTIIRSDKPIGVISGHVRTAIPQFMDQHFESKDHIAAMLPPTQSWGREFYSVPFGMNDGGDMFRITCIEPNTFVTMTIKDSVRTLQLPVPGSFATIPRVSKPAKWTSNNPVQIGQFMMRIGGDDDNLYYDPCLVILPPAEQYVNKMIFQTVGNEPVNPDQYIGYAIYLVADYEAAWTLKLDNKLVRNLDSNFVKNVIPKSSRFWTRLLIPSGKHILTSDKGNFSGVTYGFGQADAYAMTLGSSLSNPYVDDSIPPNIFIEEHCGKISGTISEPVDPNSSGLLFAVMNDNSFNYKYTLNPEISDFTFSTTFTAEPIDYMQNGRFIFEYRDKNGNGNVYDHFYYGVGMDIPDTLDFGVVNNGDSVCIYQSLLASGNISVRLDSIKFGRVDKRLHLYNITPVPATLNNGDRIEFNLCFAPNNNVNYLEEKLYLYFDCDRVDSIIVLASIKAPGLLTIGYNFDKICLGDSAIGIVSIVNNGNVKIKIDSIREIIPNNQFDYKSLNTKIFPRTLSPGDSVSALVIFKPLVLGISKLFLSADNNSNIVNQFIVAGIGVSSEINSININWGKKRIGTKNDSVFYLRNDGECDAHIIFDGFDGNIMTFFKDSLDSINTIIAKSDSLKFFSSFIPNKVDTFRLLSFYRILAPNQEPVIINLFGIGSLPIITTKNVDFDTLDIFTTKDTTSEIIYSGGNERLWLDYKSMEGDTNSFTVMNNKLSDLKNIYLDSGKTLQIPIEFHPLKLGLHQMALHFTHDAMPNYNTDDTVIYISGFAVPADTIQANLSTNDNFQYLPCRTNVFPFYIENSGNVSLSLDTIDIIYNNVDAQWEYPLGLPINIEPDSTLILNLNIIPWADQKANIQIYSVFNDTIKYLSDVYDINETINKLSINPPTNERYKIGDTTNMTFSGKIPNGIEDTIDFNLEYNIDQHYFFLLENQTNLIVSNSSSTNTIPVGLLQTIDKIIVSNPQKININDSSDWSMNLKLLTLLSQEKTTKITAKVSANQCYESAEIEFNPTFYGVCAFDLRKIVKSRKVIPEVQIVPNPAFNELCIKINLMSDDLVIISIYDDTGKNILKSQNFNLKKGSYSLIFEISQWACGIYMLSVETSLGLNNRIFMINK